MDRPLRIYVAGAADAPITHAALESLARNRDVVLVGIDLDRLDPGRLREAAPDLLLSAAHRRLIRPPELAVARLGTIGLHPALLPRYRGSHPLWWALHNGESRAGLSLYVLDEGIDTGPVIEQRDFAIEHGDTFGSLYVKAAALVDPLVVDLVAATRAADALPPATVQDESQATLYREPTHRDIYGTPIVRARRVARRLAVGAAASIASFIETIGPSAGQH